MTVQEFARDELPRDGLAAQTPPEGVVTGAINPQDPLTILAGIEQFGLAADGSDLRDLRTALEAQAEELAIMKEMYAREGAKALYELERASLAEAKLAEANKKLDEIEKEAKVSNDVIRMNRDGGGQGRVKVATAMHRIERIAREQGGENNG